MSERNITLYYKTIDRITLYYKTIDRFSERRTFKTLKGARAYARKRMGTSYYISETFHYAVSFDGVGKLEARGATLDELLKEDA